jgi:NADH-quinone oxidoreductase subunit M
MLTVAPHLASLLTVAVLASIGLPGLAGFLAEMLALLGAFQPAPDLSGGLFLVFMATGGIGAVLTVAYFLRMVSRTHPRAGVTPNLLLHVSPITIAGLS